MNSDHMGFIYNYLVDNLGWLRSVVFDNIADIIHRNRHVFCNPDQFQTFIYYQRLIRNYLEVYCETETKLK